MLAEWLTAARRVKASPPCVLDDLVSFCGFGGQGNFKDRIIRRVERRCDLPLQLALAIRWRRPRQIFCDSFGLNLRLPNLGRRPMPITGKAPGFQQPERSSCDASRNRLNAPNCG
jgi:hypothetical protein